MSTTVNSGNQGFELFTSLRYDPALLLSQDNTRVADGVASPFLFLTLHRDRVWAAAQAFGWTTVANLIKGEEGLLFFAHAIQSTLEARVEDGNDVAYKVWPPSTYICFLSS